MARITSGPEGDLELASRSAVIVRSKFLNGVTVLKLPFRFLIDLKLPLTLRTPAGILEPNDIDHRGWTEALRVRQVLDL